MLTGEARVDPPSVVQPSRPPWRRALLVALASYVAIRVLDLAILGFAAHRVGLPFWSLLGRYDAGHYLAIAQHGYDARATQPSGAPAVASAVFPPLFPGLLGIALRVLPGPDLAAALAVTWLCGLAAAAALFRLGVRLLGPRGGVAMVGLWAVLPHAIVSSMAYSENLFIALAAWSLVLLLDERLLPAAVVCVLAGLTRPSSVALVAAVVVAAFLAARRDGDRRAAWVAALVAPLGIVGYGVWVAVHTGRWDGYFWLQDKVWHSRFDAGGDTMRTMGHVFSTGRPLAYVVTTAVVLAAVVGAGFAIADRRLPAPVTVYAVVLLLLVLGTGGYYYDKGRLLLPAFGLLIPLARRVASAPPAVRVAVLFAAAVGSSWYGAYLLTRWHYSP